MSPHFGVSVPYFHGRYSKGHFEVLAMSGRGSTKSERYQPTTNEKPSETMFQRVLLDFVLKTFGLWAENETRHSAYKIKYLSHYQLVALMASVKQIIGLQYHPQIYKKSKTSPKIKKNIHVFLENTSNPIILTFQEITQWCKALIMLDLHGLLSFDLLHIFL